MALPESSGKAAGGFGRVLVRFWEVEITLGLDRNFAGGGFQVPYLRGRRVGR